MPHDALALALVTMISATLFAEKSGAPRHAARICGCLAALAVVLIVSTGAHNTAAQLWSLLWSAGSTLRTPTGILGFCRSVRTLAEAQMPQVLVLVFSLYLTLQTFCIPGTVALNAVVGALLPLFPALLICVIAGTIGASCCYTLSSIFGTRLVDSLDAQLMKGKGVQKLRIQVNKFRSDLFVYLLFLRLTPILPNWLINLASPVVNVPLSSFAMATAVGITPQTYLAVRFGTLANADFSQGVASVVTLSDTALIALLGVVVLVASKLKKKFADEPTAGVAASNAAHAHASPAVPSVAGSFPSVNGSTAAAVGAASGRRRNHTPDKNSRFKSMLQSI